MEKKNYTIKIKLLPYEMERVKKCAEVIGISQDDFCFKVFTMGLMQACFQFGILGLKAENEEESKE